MRRVVWPTRQETNQTTLMVVVVVTGYGVDPLGSRYAFLGWLASMVIAKMCKRWYVVHAYSGYEKKVAAALQERVVLAWYGRQFGDILVPTEEVVEMRAGQKRKSERKFFPGYVLGADGAER